MPMTPQGFRIYGSNRSDHEYTQLKARAEAAEAERDRYRKMLEWLRENGIWVTRYGGHGPFVPTRPVCSHRQKPDDFDAALENAIGGGDAK